MSGVVLPNLDAVDWDAVLSHSDLIERAVNSMRGRWPYSAEDPGDLRYDAMLGLAKALNFYDESRGGFGPFAGAVMRSAMRTGTAIRRNWTSPARGKGYHSVPIHAAPEIADPEPEREDEVPSGYVEVRAMVTDREAVTLMETSRRAAEILGTTPNNARKIRERARRRVLATLDLAGA